MKLRKTKDIGVVGEKIASKHLKKEKYKILDKNYTTKTAEIDIIAKKDETVVFVEVKTRKHNPMITGSYSVNDTKQKHIIKAAQHYISANKITADYRFDVIEIEMDENFKKCVAINHIENAFIQNENYSRF
ncbi:MAG: YraN family protein [Oscillospiraceae bacterium]|nr:YraN family protein [Candidatus Ruminococcus equi]